MRGGSAAAPQPLIMPADGPDAKVYEAAIRRAIEAVNADGGAIATLDDTQLAMVLRVRQVHPRLRPAITRVQTPADQRPDIGEANTTVLPTPHLWRFYRRGERLIGYTWESSQPVMLSQDEVRGLPGGASPEDPPAAFHMAVPIFTPLPEDVTVEEPKVMGVLTVYVNDPQWRFSLNQIQALKSQAVIVAQSLLLAHIVRQEQSHQRLLRLLQELTANVPVAPDIEAFYEQFGERVYVAISGVVECEAFAIAIPGPEGHLTLYSVIEHGQRLPSQRLSFEQAPWWKDVRVGQAIPWTSDDYRRAMPHLRARAWGSEQYMDSQLFVPIRSSGVSAGALLVASQRTNAYLNDADRLLDMAGRFFGLAIENAQLHAARPSAGGTNAETQRALALLNNSLLGLNATLDVEVIVRDYVEQSSELARGQVCGYLEYDRQTDELVLRDVAQNKDHPHHELIGQRLPAGDGRLRHSLDGQVQVLDDLRAEWERGDLIGKLLERYHAQAMLIVPVIHVESVTHRDRVIGLLAVYTPDQRALFSPAEEMNLQALGRVAAAALHNARTYAQLRELDRLKDEFILTASHEFRTPMSAITGFSWLIQRNVEKMTSEQGKRWAEEIIRATEQLKDMMDSLTETWRGRSVAAPPLRPVSIAAAWRAAVEISSGLLAAENHQVTEQVADDLWAQGDAERLRHVLSNLLNNAAKYSPAGATIQVAASVASGVDVIARPRQRGTRDEDETPVSNVTANSGPWVVVSVRDHGLGMKAEDQKRLFAKFVRLQLTTSVRGTGLGLYICRRYVEAMGGEIWVESAPDQGSTFTFCLPRVAAPPGP